MLRLVLMFVLCCVTAASADGGAPIKVMTFNIKYDGSPGKPSADRNAWVATSGVHRRDLALQVVRDAAPDVWGVQEALHNQMDDFQRAFPEYQHYGVGRDDGVEAGEYCGIYYRHERFQRTAEGTFWLNEKSEQPGSKFPETCCARIASWVVLEDNQADGQAYLVINTHWDHQIQPAREFSAKLIRQRLDKLADGRPVILMGDLNATPENPAFVRLLPADEASKIELLDAYRTLNPQPSDEELTSHGYRGGTTGRRIDYVLHSGYFRPQAAQILRYSVDGHFPSDHYPVLVTLMPSSSAEK